MKHTKQNHTNCLVLCLLIVILTGPLAATDEEPFTGYVKKPTWQQTMLRTRENLRPYLHQLDAIIKTIRFGPWYCTDPIPVKGFAEKAFPEETIFFEFSYLHSTSINFSESIDIITFLQTNIHILPKP
ncbi:MAG: hypothetical protein ACYSWP_05785, partial [Planctomycetota bacterium]